MPDNIFYVGNYRYRPSNNNSIYYKGYEFGVTANNYLYFNEDFNAKYSLEQPIFVKKYVTNKYEVAPTSTVEEGDFIIKINDSGQKEEILVESINVVTEQDTKVILFSCEPQDWFIAGDNLVHNK